MVDLRDGEAEQGVVGAFLLGVPPELASRVRDVLPDALAFGYPQYAHAYAVVVSLLDRGIPIDPLTLRDEALRLLRPLDADVAAQLADAVPTATNVLFHAHIVRDLWLRREMVRQGQQAIQRAEARDLPIEQGYAETVTGLVNAAAPVLSKSAVPLASILGIALEALSERGDSPLDAGAIGSGLGDLDALLGGLAPGRLIVVAARPKKGKTALALHIARHAGVPIYHFSMEMGEGELAGRLLCAEAGVRQRHRYTDAEVTSLTNAANDLRGLRYTVDTHADRPGLMRLALQAQIAQGTPPGLVIIDYLQLMRWPGKVENKNIEVSNITRFLKRDIAQSLNLPVLLLSQLSRASVEGGKERPPILSDLRDSGSIEQDADQIVMLHYGGADDGKSDVSGWESPTITELYVRGNRHGPGGKVPVYYDRPTGVWRDLSRYDAS